MLLYLFVFFKQKTAYDMRISDWSSDVCSSDLQQEDRALRDEVFRLRYQVYCVENPFEDPAEHPDGLEHDVYDERATHCLLFHKRTESWAGTARLILPNAEDPNHSFALQEV